MTTGSASATAPTSRIGGGGDDNYMVDGVTTMDPGVNRPASRISAEAISEVKVDTFGYQAEYGRSSGLQINAVTKSGTNQFRGSFYDVERHSSFGYANSKTNILNGDPKPLVDERDWGWSIGGPIGKPGGNNKLFFFYNQEFNPRTVGQRASRRYRDADAARAAGRLLADDRQPRQSVSVHQEPDCRGRVQRDEPGGLLQRRRRARQDSGEPVCSRPGLNILKWWPAPNCPAECPRTGQRHTTTRRPTRQTKLLGWQPVIRLDYAADAEAARQLQVSAVLSSRTTMIPGIIPGWSDATQDDYGIYTLVVRRQLHAEQLDVHRGSVGAEHAPPGRLLDRRRRPELVHHRRSGESEREPHHRRFRRHPVSVSGCDAHRSRAPSSYEILNNLGSRDDGLGRRARAGGSDVRVGLPASRNAPPNNSAPFGNFILDTVSGNANITLTKVSGQPHVQARLLLLQERAEARHRRHLRVDQLRERHQQPPRFVVRLRERRARRVQLGTRSSRAGVKARSPPSTTSSSSRTTGR